MIDFSLNLDGAALALDARFSLRVSHQHGAFQADLRGVAKMSVIDGLGGAGYNCYSI